MLELRRNETITFDIFFCRMESENLLEAENFSKYKTNKLQASPREALRVRRNKTRCFPWGQSLSAY